VFANFALGKYAVHVSSSSHSGPFPKKDSDFPNGIILGELELVSRWRWLAAAMRFYVHLESKHNPGSINY
jgi:hypothetical protein